ncbi:unnamed protein product [Amoebophrya sp. A25]|nr:unnamed protein product [Amoebophrya sp. A25]|eukprot:GSA25T00017352001.1
MKKTHVVERKAKAKAVEVKQQQQDHIQFVIDTHVHLLLAPQLPYSWLRSLRLSDEQQQVLLEQKYNFKAWQQVAQACSDGGRTSFFGSSSGRDKDEPGDKRGAANNRTYAFRVLGGIFIETGVDSGFELHETLLALGYVVENDEEWALLKNVDDARDDEKAIKAVAAPPLLGVCAHLPCHEGALAVKAAWESIPVSLRGHVVSTRLPLHVPGSPDILSDTFIEGLRALGSGTLEGLRGLREDETRTPTCRSLEAQQESERPSKAGGANCTPASLLYEFCVYGVPGMIAVTRVCDMLPDQNFILQHAAFIGATSSNGGKSTRTSTTGHWTQEWHAAITELAKRKNLMGVKISGIEEWRLAETDMPCLPYIDELIRVFGCQRILVGSNFFLCETKGEQELQARAIGDRVGLVGSMNSKQKLDGDDPEVEILLRMQSGEGSARVGASASAKNGRIFGHESRRVHDDHVFLPETRTSSASSRTTGSPSTAYASCFEQVALSLDRLGATRQDRDDVFWRNAVRIYHRSRIKKEDDV